MMSSNSSGPLATRKYDDGLQLSLKRCFGLKLVYMFVLLHSCCKQFSRLASQAFNAFTHRKMKPQFSVATVKLGTQNWAPVLFLRPHAVDGAPHGAQPKDCQTPSNTKQHASLIDSYDTFPLLTYQGCVKMVKQSSNLAIVHSTKACTATPNKAAAPKTYRKSP